MISVDEFSGIVECVYAATLDPALWRTALSSITEALSGCGALLGISRAGHPGSIEFVGYDPQSIATFAEYYADKSYVWSLLAHAPEGVAIHDRSVMPPDRRKKDVFANEWALANDTADCVILPLVRQTIGTAFVIFARSIKIGTFEDETLKLIARLKPHLRSAAEIRLRLDRIDSLRQQYLDSLERLSQAVALLSKEGAMIFANSAAHQLLRQSPTLTLRNSMLVAKGPNAIALRQFVARATGEVNRVPTAETILINQPDGQSLLLSAVPLNNNMDRELGRSAAVLLSISESSSAVHSSMLKSFYRLTPAETRVALKLADGLSIEDIAISTNTSKNTVRTHLYSALAKTNTNRQIDLVRLVCTMPCLTKKQDLPRKV